MEVMGDKFSSARSDALTDPTGCHPPVKYNKLIERYSLKYSPHQKYDGNISLCQVVSKVGPIYWSSEHRRCIGTLWAGHDCSRY